MIGNLFKKLSLTGLGVSVLMLTPALGPGTASAASNVAINWNDVKQEIDGFGVSQAAWSDAIYDLQEPARSQIMDLLFRQDTGIGASILRGAIFPQFNPAPGQYDFNARPDQVWVMQQAKARGVNKLVASTWSPPAWMKTNNSTTNGGYLKSENYDDYAVLMSKFVKEYKSQFNLDLYGVSVANEPNSMTFLTWDSSEWNSTNFQVFLKDYLKPEMINQGVQGTKVIVGESSWWSEDLVKDSLNDPASAERIDIVGGHNYPIPIINTTMPTEPFATAAAKGKKVWMTEVSDVDSYDPGIGSGLKFAKQIHNFMTKANVNAWLYWTGAIPGNNDEGLINVDKATSTYAITKRYYTLGSYSKYIRPGYVRIGATENPVSGVYTTAYKDPATGKITIVAVNDGDASAELNFVPNGFTLGKLTPYTTDSTLNMAQGRNVQASGGSLHTIIPAKSVVTYVGQSGSTADPAETQLNDPLNNWTKTASHTSGLALDSSNSLYFGGDSSRVKRTTGTTESFVYNVNNMTGFNATIYHASVWDGVAFYTSPDNATWTRISHVSTPGAYTGSNWYRKTYAPVPLLPTGTKYLKIELSGTDSWEKQVANVVITSSP
ncbi:glycoside hydrolase family 30 protein [Paenibacillus methanolicus]|uniref:Glucuronoarabinoxylan endo-1,4-beta-xylanase n=1 Tax=Paenibacillus methanolicus TaxID=582686 RepID=A0A5S5CKX1_9BACL|nr:glycoside hydrolase [Paenibacillus methanolicus]TYP79028.1 glucuronoarabinoxylan endo-1,4-beta-xylanase [Paenibacillus methanolicus]